MLSLGRRLTLILVKRLNHLLSNRLDGFQRLVSEYTGFNILTNLSLGFLTFIIIPSVTFNGHMETVFDISQVFGRKLSFTVVREQINHKL